jgi:hypothetical protein
MSKRGTYDLIFRGDPGCSLHPLERYPNREKKKKQKICEFKALAKVGASQGFTGTLENRVFLANRWVSNWV